MKEKPYRSLMIVKAFGILPYQGKRLEELAKATKRPQSELVREALSLLFAVYKKMGQ